MISRLATRTGLKAARSYSRSAVAKEPKLHNATGNWETLKAKRPVDADDLHVRNTTEFRIPSHPNPTQLVFHTPFNTVTVVGMLAFVLLSGYGSMAYGVIHQQVCVISYDFDRI